ncbi:MAG TPA: carboxymuconolactone decarboxylase family protein [Methanobacterium sp.]|jgi:AhpD family alkylhydroperoxidase|nr:MAG: carboxymuconolactone decarboxylase family protein [Methanobacterium sp.]HOI72112.1 carboxymuconolactone decarboxylase family protein [Methanobacterium sp.]HPX77332.1 carboxymuconolactone decarboxylase family protein [Methanobacterium sp.]
MSKKPGSEELPPHYVSIKERFVDYGKKLSDLGREVKDLGPLDNKTCELIQIAASAAIRSEGAVHSHARRAIEAGASDEEVYQSVVLLTSTIGFPNVAAAISWIDDILKNNNAPLVRKSNF